MVKKNCRLGLTALFCVLGIGAFAQDANEIFAPFVSGLEAEVKNSFIRLSWTDSPNVKGPVFVYRSDEPFTGLQAANLPRPAEVAYGTGSYLDEADRPGTIYYFIAASDEWDRKYALAIPYTNTVSVVVELENVAAYFRDTPSSPSGFPAPQAASPPGNIRGLSAKAEEGRIVLNYEGADAQKNAILYRSVSPIRRQEDLLQAVIVKQRISSPYIDYPVPGIAYYYAVIYEEELGVGVIRQGVNATAAPVRVSAGSSQPALPAPETGPRSMPLPQISLNGLDGSGTTAVPLGPEAAAAAASLAPRSTGTGKRGPVVFPEDLETAAAGEEYQLRSIVQGYFSLSDWSRAGEELRSFLALPRSKQNTAKANFYLGQTYYFQGSNREALFALLAAQDLFPGETAPWIQAVLGQITQ
ncbi:MAG: hypothetical protein LBB82_05745 [Treponema sp.]|jgi:hypothetical protein|nr:hypothetical protein [Treponema sp.]